MNKIRIMLCFIYVVVALNMLAVVEVSGESSNHGQWQDRLQQHEQFRQLDGMKPENAELSFNDAKIDLEAVYDRQILIKQKEGRSLPFAQLGVTPVETPISLKQRSYQLIRVPESLHFNTVLNRIQQRQEVVVAEPNWLRETTAVPTDPEMTKQWYLQRIGMPKVWEMAQSSEEITIAVLDTGVKGDHPDLQGRILAGKNYINADEPPSDDNGHGTYVAGIIAANANDIGIAGLASNVKIMPMKIADDHGSIQSTHVIQAINDAVEAGVDIINMSYAGVHPNALEQEAIMDAYKAGIVLVAAAGNRGREGWFYPASYDGVISVAATDADDRRASFSNYGSRIDVAAPGVQIYSTNHKDGYGLEKDSGTSFAAPMVSALAALIKAQRPDWTPAEIEWAIEHGADQREEGFWNRNLGYGRLNVYDSLQLQSLPTEASNDEVISLPMSHPVRNKLHLPMEIDNYEFTIDRPETITVELKDESSYLDHVIVIEGSTLEQEMYINRSGPGEGENYTFEAEPGTYEIAVFDAYNHWSEKNYELNVLVREDGFFPDISEHWAEAEIRFLIGLDIIDGYEDGSFRPERTITRAEAVKMIVEVLELPPAAPAFSDVSDHFWGNEYIGAAEVAGIVEGYQNGMFGPQAAVTREEAAAMLVRAYKLTGEGDVPFSDVDRNMWSYSDIQALVDEQAVSGYPDNTFRPYNAVSRAEFSAMLARVIDSAFR